MSNQSEAVVASRYLELVTQCPLRPIRSDAELDRAIAMIDSLIDLGSSNRNLDEDDYLQVLGDLVHQYEQEEHPIPRGTEAGLLQHLLEAQGISSSELAALSGISESKIERILSDQRGISPNDAHALSRCFHTSHETFRT